MQVETEGLDPRAVGWKAAAHTMSSPSTTARAPSAGRFRLAKINLQRRRVFVELNYPHITGFSGYERHHDMAT